MMQASKSLRFGFSPFLVMLGLIPGILSGAEPTKTNAPSRTDFSQYQIISERNIFNTRRYARNTPAPPTRETPRRYVRTESVALVGTMGYAKGPYAFFEGSSSAFSKVARLNDEVAGFRITQIHPNRVKLENATNSLELKIGYQLRREDLGPWKVSEREESRNSYASSPSSNSRRSSTPTPPPSNSSSNAASQSEPGFGDMMPPLVIIDPNSGEPTVLAQPPEGMEGGPPQPPGAPVAAPAAAALPADETLRRLMERRAQELNR